MKVFQILAGVFDNYNIIILIYFLIKETYNIPTLGNASRSYTKEVYYYVNET